MVAYRFTILGSIVVTRAALAESLEFADEGKVRARTEVEPLSAINALFNRLCSGGVDGRIVLTL
jgi:propanol-preferring alcohol dehydrogenase